MSSARLAPWSLALPFAATLGLALLAGTPARAAPKPLTKEEQAKVDRAIERGVAYIKRTQLKNGTWHRPQQNETVTFPLGYAMLPALALLESGVPADDPCVQKVADLLRRNVGKMHETYEVSLAVLFLDRLGDSKDEELTRDLGLRLVAFQSYSGGWGYNCPTLSKKSRDDLLRALRDFPKEEGTRRGTRKAPPSLNRLAIFRRPSELMRPIEPDDKGYVLYVGTTDNSNTQFALLALWAARRHGVPIDRTIRLAVQRFQNSQLRDGTWTYRYPVGGFDNRRPKSSRSMITVGLLGLAMGYGVETGEERARAAVGQQIGKGFAALSRVIDEPTGQMTRPVFQPDLYFLWSAERVAVLYDLPEIGDKDWYRWGAEILVTNQKAEGDWRQASGAKFDPRDVMVGYRPFENTAFALLFLKRSNLVKGLTAKLPFKPEELNKSILATRAGGAPAGILSPGLGER